jgi:hypothetical protein
MLTWMDHLDRAEVYRLVLAEGTEEDVRRFIDVDELVLLWPRVYLPRHVRRSWAAWLEERRGLDLAC